MTVFVCTNNAGVVLGIFDTFLTAAESWDLSFKKKCIIRHGKVYASIHGHVGNIISYIVHVKPQHL